MVKAAGEQILRGGAFKPSTFPYAFQGLEEEDLKLLAEVRDETELPIITEVMNPRDLEKSKTWNSIPCSFFFGVITAVGALQYLGYLALASKSMYGGLGFTTGNVLVDVLSAIVDNIPVMFGVLKMDPDMGLDQWLLITLTTGTGGSLLSIGSAAGVAVMGVRRDVYTFMTHLKWTPVIALGYAGSILCW